MEIQTNTVKEVAAQLRVGTIVIYRLLRTGKMVGRKVGRGWRITPEAVAAYLAGGHREEEGTR